ncbi:SETMR methyltransferase, partial [Acromyrmex charruanus]
MEKNEFRPVIKHLHIKSLMPKEIKAELDNVHSTSAPAFAIVYNWVNKFKRGRTHVLIHYETWIHYFTPDEGTVKTMDFIEPAPKKAKTVKSAGKQTINGDYYVALLDRFNNILDSHPAPMAKFNEFRYELLPHPAYSPDLALWDYFLFPNLKKWFGGKRFTREQFIAETEAYFEGLDKSYYSDGLKKLKNRWIKCIELKGDYKKMCFTMFF